MVRFLQKRKFRLVTRWKQALRNPGDLHRPEPNPIKNTLIFRVFDDVMREIKTPTDQWSLDTTPGYAHYASDEGVTNPDQYVELFLAGRRVLADFINHDAAFSAQFDRPAREDLQAACDRVLMHFVDRELSGNELRRTAPHQHKEA